VEAAMTVEERFNKRAMEIGAMPAIDEFRKSGDFDDDNVDTAHAILFKVFLREVAEAQKEVKRLEAVLARMDVVARRGTMKKRIGQAVASPDVTQFDKELNAFQGWLTSLYETFMTIYSIQYPQNVQTKIQQMASAQQALWNSRKAKAAARLKDPALFAALTSL
jgi:hypothetical protein